MSRPGDPSEVATALRSALEAAAAPFALPSAAGGDGGPATWSAAGRPIVVLEGATASFRLGAEIGAAARRTADAGDSSLGPEWVAFHPPTLDEHARDRITAWFAAAHRRAGSPGR